MRFLDTSTVFNMSDPLSIPPPTKETPYLQLTENHKNSGRVHGSFHLSRPKKGTESSWHRQRPHSDAEMPQTEESDNQFPHPSIRDNVASTLSDDGRFGEGRESIGCSQRKENQEQEHPDRYGKETGVYLPLVTTVSSYAATLRLWGFLTELESMLALYEDVDAACGSITPRQEFSPQGMLIIVVDDRTWPAFGNDGIYQIRRTVNGIRHFGREIQELKRDGQGTVEESTIERFAKVVWRMAVNGINRYAAGIEGDDTEDGDEGGVDIGRQKKDLSTVWVGIRAILDNGRKEAVTELENMKRALIQDIEKECRKEGGNI